jgi:hypothetical protein
MERVVVAVASRKDEGYILWEGRRAAAGDLSFLLMI